MTPQESWHALLPKEPIHMPTRHQVGPNFTYGKHSHPEIQESESEYVDNVPTFKSADCYYSRTLRDISTFK